MKSKWRFVWVLWRCRQWILYVILCFVDIKRKPLKLICWFILYTCASVLNTVMLCASCVVCVLRFTAHVYELGNERTFGHTKAPGQKKTHLFLDTVFYLCIASYYTRDFLLSLAVSLILSLPRGRGKKLLLVSNKWLAAQTSLRPGGCT